MFCGIKSFMALDHLLVLDRLCFIRHFVCHSILWLVLDMFSAIQY